MMNKILMLALICLVGAASATVYDVEVNILMKSEEGCSAEDAASLDAIIQETFAAVDMREAGNSGNWIIGNNGKNGHQGEPGDFRGRELVNCNEARELCQLGLAYYCEYACKKRRRQLRSLQSVAEVQAAAKSGLDSRLANAPAISCVAEPLETLP